MKVSVITRTKNRPLMLQRAKASVLSQNINNLEWIIVNDGGDAVSVDVIVKDPECQKLSPIIIHNQSSLGMEAASNTGIRASSGDLIVIHDDDDSWEPSFLKETISHLASSPNSMGCVTLSNKVVETISDKAVKVFFKKRFNKMSGIYLSAVLKENAFPPISFVYRKSVWSELNGYNEDLPVLGDWDFNIRFLLKYDIDLIPQYLANYHLRPNIEEGTYGNSLFNGADKHSKYDAVIRNKYLREDLNLGRLGIGMVMGEGRNWLEFENKYKKLEVILNTLWIIAEKTRLKVILKYLLLKKQ